VRPKSRRSGGERAAGLPDERDYADVYDHANANAHEHVSVSDCDHVDECGDSDASS